MRRLHAAKDDLDWLPQRYRVLRGAIVGSVWTVLGGGLLGLFTIGAAKGMGYFIGKGAFAVGAGGYWLGDRASKSLITRRLGKLTSGDVDLARLSNSTDGDLVHVRGVVRATQTVPSAFGGAPGVYRRLRATFGERQAIEEEAVDFQLVDADGHAITVEVEGARWLVHDGKQMKVLREVVETMRELPFVKKYFAHASRRTFFKKKSAEPVVKATEEMLRPGDEVEVVGYKSRQVDASVVDRMARETPMRATLRSGKDLPVMISRSKGSG